MRAYVIIDAPLQCNGQFFSTKSAAQKDCRDPTSVYFRSDISRHGETRFRYCKQYREARKGLEELYLATGSGGVIDQQIDQTFRGYFDSLSQSSPPPPTNTSSQNFGSTFNPRHASSSYQSPGVGELADYQHPDANSGQLRDFGHSNTSYSASGTPQVYNQLSLRPAISNTPYGHEGLAQVYQQSLSETNTIAVLSRDPNDAKLVSHVNDSLEGAWDGLELLSGPSRITNTPCDDMLIDPCGIDPVAATIEPVSDFTPEELSSSSPGPSPSSIDTDSLQPRFACHHPQCNGKGGVVIGSLEM
ncbi:hypothetical protein F5884DRAFT_838293 [Xylogone sp. PMI_703]|nr:hypothetical protein F5884DRAFT_838293 [Xylogone sp. PMI_703]